MDDVPVDIIRPATDEHKELHSILGVASDGFCLWIKHGMGNNRSFTPNWDQLSCLVDDRYQAEECERFEDGGECISTIPLPTLTVPEVVELKFSTLDKSFTCFHKVLIDTQVFQQSLRPTATYRLEDWFSIGDERIYFSSIQQTEVGLYLDAGFNAALDRLSDRGFLAAACILDDRNEQVPLVPICIRGDRFFACTCVLPLAASEVLARISFVMSPRRGAGDQTCFRMPAEE